MTVISCVTLPASDEASAPGKAAGLAVLSFRGNLDARSTAELRTTLCLAVGARLAILDLAKVATVDASALRALVEGIREVQEHRGRAAVIVRLGPVASALVAGGVSRIAPIFPALEDDADLDSSQVCRRRRSARLATSSSRGW